MNVKKEFGKLMHLKRLKIGITQEKLSELVGISPTYCRKIEHGKYFPTWIIWLKICVVLDINITEIKDILAFDTDKCEENIDKKI